MSKWQKTLLASQLQEKLRIMIASHGDRLVYLEDPDTQWALGIDLSFPREFSDWRDEPIFLITADYQAAETVEV